MRYWYCELPPQLVCNTSPPYPVPNAPPPPLLRRTTPVATQSQPNRSRSHHRCRRRGRRRSRSLPFIIALLARQSGVSWPPCSLSLSARKYAQANIHTCIHTYLFIHVRMRALLSLSLRRRLLSVYACMCVPTSLSPLCSPSHLPQYL